MLYAFILTLLATTASPLRVVPVTAYIQTDMIYFVSRYPILSNTCGTDYAAHTAAAYVTFCIALYSANSRPIHWYRNSFGSGHIYIYVYEMTVCRICLIMNSGVLGRAIRPIRARWCVLERTAGYYMAGGDIYVYGNTMYNMICLEYRESMIL